LAGAALTAQGLATRCEPGDPCGVRVSLLTWGGIGVASGGALFGFTMLQQADSATAENHH
jgi:hypothetical protein